MAQWYSQNSGTDENLLSVCFTDTLNGWVAGLNGVILHTDNGGDSWEEQNSGTSNNLLYVYFKDSVHGWVIGRKYGWPYWGIVLRTVDGGNNWEEISEGPSLYKPYFLDTLNGFAVGIHGILSTSDGGENWESQHDGSYHFGEVYFTDSLKGWTVCSLRTSNRYTHSYILNTINGGTSWNYQYENHGFYTPILSSVYFTDSLTGWACGGNPVLSEIILKTTDGGINWDTAYYNVHGTLNSIDFADAFNGCAVGYIGTIIYTSDGGNTWLSESSGTTNTLHDVHFTENGYGWAVGDGGTILHADYSQTVGLDESEVQSATFGIRCFPNPFTTSTTIEYELKQPEKVSLTIYNHLGQLVCKVEENQRQGKQQLIWNVEGFADGVYYYRLQVGDAVANGKVLKVR